MLTVLIFTESGWPTIPGSQKIDMDVQYKEMIGVGRVVVNRMRASRWPSSMYDVIHQKGQFAVVRNGALLRRYNQWMDGSYKNDYAPWRFEMSNKAAKEILAGGSWDFDFEFFRAAEGYENYYQKSVVIGHTLFHNGVKK